MLQASGSGIKSCGSVEGTQASSALSRVPSVMDSQMLTLRADAALPAYECLMGVALFKQMKLSAGCIVCVRSSHGAAYLEACLSTSLSGHTIVLGDDTFGLLLDHEVKVTPLPFAALPHLSCAELRVSWEDGQGNGRHASSDDRGASSELHWCALFRGAFHNRVIFTGMRTVLRFSATRVVFEVVRIQACPSAGAADESRSTSDYGMLTDGCRLSASVYAHPRDERAAEPACAPVTPSDSSASACPLCYLTSQSVLMSSLSHEQHVHATSHILFVGDSGVGKSYVLNELATYTRSLPHCTRLTIRAEELPKGVDSSEVATATALCEVFRQAHLSAPSVIFIDDLHLLCGSGEGESYSSSGGGELHALGSHWAMSVLSRTLCRELDRIEATHAAVRVWASALSLDAVDGSLRTCRRLGGSRVVRVLAPTHAAERVACLRRCIRDVVPATAAAEAAALDEAVLQAAAAHTHGFTQRDLRRVVERSLAECFRRGGRVGLNSEELLRVARVSHPSSLQHLDAVIPDITWDDIGGSAAAKQTLMEVVDWCLGKHGWVFRTFRLTPPKGVLLYGPPGCSKTMLAKALAHESGMNFISVKGPEVFSKWVGDSEKAVREIFARARASAPCVVFIDELDGMCGHRGQGGVSDRVISQFLTELDGLPAVFADQSNALVFVAATNRPDNIDAAVLRPGRIDRKVYVGLPDREERAAIVRIHLARIPTADDVSAAYVAERTEGYTGAEVVAVVKEASFIAITEDMNAKCITQSHVDGALRKVRPRVSAADVAWYATWPKSSSAK